MPVTYGTQFHQYCFNPTVSQTESSVFSRNHNIDHLHVVVDMGQQFGIVFPLHRVVEVPMKESCSLKTHFQSIERNILS